MYKKEEYMILLMFQKVIFYILFLGIGYIEKTHKNKIKWVGGNQDPNLEEDIKKI